MTTLKRRRAYRLPYVLCCLAMLALVLTDCGLNRDDPGSRLAANQILIWPLTHVPNFNALVLDPANVGDVYSESVIEAISGGLVSSDQHLNVVPDMATWEISPDGQQYTFHLRSNLHFSDGIPITAQVFAYSLDRALDPQVCIPLYGAGCSPMATVYLKDIKGADARLSGTLKSIIGTGVEAQDARTLVITLERPVAYFLEALTYPVSYPVEQSLVEKYGNNWAAHLDVGGDSGPFKIGSYGTSNLTLLSNPYWYGKHGVLKKIIRPYMADPLSAYAAYQEGATDFAEVPSEEYQSALEQADFHEVGVLATSYVGINQEAGPFSNLAVRQAFALAIDKQLLADHILFGTVLPTNHIVPQGMPGYDVGLTAPGTESHTLTGDYTQAQHLISGYFAQCGCHGLLTASITYPVEQTDGADIIAALITMWNTILSGSWGTVTVSADPVSFNDLFLTRFPETVGNHTGAMQMWFIGWTADYPDPEDFLSLQFAPDSPNNATNYHDGMQDRQKFAAWKLMAQADVEQNPVMRMNLYHQAEQELVNDVAWIPIFQGKGVWRIKPYIQGFLPTALDLLSDQEWANVAILAH